MLQKIEKQFLAACSNNMYIDGPIGGWTGELLELKCIQIISQVNYVIKVLIEILINTLKYHGTIRYFSY